jgi:hypothetical protein
MLNDALSPVHVDAAMSSFASGGSQTKQA